MDSTLTRTPTLAEVAPFSAALKLPFDHAPTPSTANQLATHEFDIELPHLSGVAADQLLVALFGAALSRYGAQDSVPFAVPRLLASGELLSLVAVHLHTGTDVTLKALLDDAGRQLCRVADVVHTAWAGGGGKAALTFVESAPGATPDILALLQHAPVELRQADWQLVVDGDGARRRCTFVYNGALFKPASMVRFAGHLGVLLARAALQLEQRVTELALLTEAEANWLDANSTGQRRALPERFLHQAFEAHCAAAPDTVALRYRDQALSYAQLNLAANRLAHQLLERRIGREDRVVVCVEPGFEIAIALLAVWKVGAVYVPLDPAYPPARIRAILDDTRPALVLTRSHLIDKLGLERSVCLSPNVAQLLQSGSSCENPNLTVDPDQTASVYYTSGTTGTPKGVMASQANVRAYIDLARERYAFGSNDVMPAIARFSFSISMFELMSPLAAGGTLVILDREHVLDLARLSRTLAEVTFFHAGPSLLKNLLAHIREQHADFNAFARVRHASSGGDMIAPEVLESLKQVFPRAEVFVIYGCSEISCMGCTYPVPRDTVVTRTYVGKPFDNMVVKLFDAKLQPVPVGVVGEIHFAGAGVVKGYLNRPELTAERFVHVDGQRFYRTGDLGRLNEDGWLEILGRNDFQINVRGMRIEIGEVEYNLRKAPGVRDAIVMAKPDASGEKVLVAYLVPDATARASTRAPERQAAVRRHMAGQLPDYMVPAHYVELDALPLNHNMKVDRRALPEPVLARARAAHDSALRAPEAATERALAAILSELLEVDRIGLDDNFFELGGHSLNARQFIDRTYRNLGARLSDMSVLRESVEVLAAMCDQQLGTSASVAPRRTPSSTPPRDRIDRFHFGPGGSLYGALHVAQGVPTDDAVLICAPLGQEHVRTHFVLNRLGRQLASRGLPTLRFDYYGCSDSLGSGIEGDCERWCEDIVSAYQELLHRTAARRVIGVGVRLGGTLLHAAVTRIDLSRLVLWDPVVDGRNHHDTLVRLHRRFLRATRDLRLSHARHVDGGQELLGSTYSHAALAQLRALRISAAPTAALPALAWLASCGHGEQRALFESLAAGRNGNEFRSLDFDCAWNDLAQMAEVLPDVGIGKHLLAMVQGCP
jgi:amino acid adenylation domain-containing protein